MATVKAALRACRAGSSTIDVFDLIASYTDHRDWTDGGNPVCFREQSAMAAEVGISERQFRRHERWLEHLGVLERATADNGYRGRRRSEDGDATIAGLSLRPSMRNQAALQSLVRESTARRRKTEQIRLAIRVERQRIKTTLGTVTPESRLRYQQQLDESEASRVRGGRSDHDLGAMSKHLLALQNLLATMSAELEAESPVNNVRETPPSSLQTSAAPDIYDRPHIQSTTKPDVIRNAEAVEILPADKPADTISSEQAAYAARTCLEKKGAGRSEAINPEIARLLTPQRLAAMASEDLALYLRAYPDQIEAMKAYLAACGVNRSAWNDAASVMGEHVAFVAALVLDRNREHPSKPVACLAGALRGITLAAQGGTMNLTRSIIALWKREDDGSQPKPAHNWVN